MQAQDFPAAKWALAQRVAGATEAGLDRLFDSGAILRTHVLRPTWHLVLPEDVGWMLELTGPRVRAGMQARHRFLGLDEASFRAAQEAFASALSGGRCLTRVELGEVLRGAGIADAEGSRLHHLVLVAELDGLIVSGPRHGREVTYSLLSDRAPRPRTMSRADAVVELVRRYFTARGPAQVQDFVWWSGLTMADTRAGIAAAGADLQRCVVDGREHWLSATAVKPPDPSSAVHLLPNFDELTVAYRDRAALIDPARPFDRAFFALGSVLSNVVTVGGRVHGRWRRTVSGRGVRLEVGLIPPRRRATVALIDDAAQRMEQFLQRPVEVVLEDV